MKFENAIICDEVRVEDTGKHIIIGVYSESIAVSDFPANLLLSFWIQFYVDRDGEIDIELRILSNKKQVAHARGKLIINDYKNKFDRGHRSLVADRGLHESNTSLRTVTSIGVDARGSCDRTGSWWPTGPMSSCSSGLR